MPSTTPDAESRTSSVVDLVLDLARAPPAGAEQVYRRRLEDGSEKRATFHWSPQVDEDIAAVQRAPVDPVAAARLGDVLRAFLQPLAWWRDEERILEALEEKRPIRLRLRLDADELHALPWELLPLGSTGRPLGSLPGCVLQYEWPDAETVPLAPATSEHVLFAWSDAGGRVLEKKHLAALQGAGRSASYEVIERVSIEALDQRLRAGSFSILHLVCHGTTDDTDGLVLHGSGGSDKEVIDSERLRAVLAPHAGSLRLVVLCPAHGPSPGPLSRRTGSIAHALHRAGIPAVVAPRHPLATEVPVELAGAFYEALFTGAASTEEAFLAARDRLGSAPRQPGWASIQLYARSAPGAAPAVAPPSSTPRAPAEPFAAVLEIVRAKESHDPYAFSWQEQAYVRRLEGGAARDASFPWLQVQSDLQAMQGREPDPEAASRLGAAMRAFLDALEWDRDEEHLRKALAAGRAAHVTFRFGAAELHALPWEIVLPGCVVYYEWPDTETARPDPDPPPEGGRILFAWSGAGGKVPWPEHQVALREACNEGRHGALDVLGNASLGALAAKLREAPVAVLHLLCHGSLTEGQTAYGLVLDSGRATGSEVVDAGSLQRVLADHLGSLRLVVLCACYAGNPGALDSHLGSVAQELHRAGVPAVVASRYPLETGASIALARELYRQLLVESVSLEQAFAKARVGPGPSGAASLQLYARASDGVDHRPIVRRPYRGLLAFEEEHARYFFGRDEEIGKVVAKLRALGEVKDPARARFVIIAGASGSGKSSLVPAGVMPALRREDPRYVCAYLRPHDDWKGALDGALSSRSDPGAPLLLVVDQLEEVFTAMADKGAREAFVQALWQLAADPGSRAGVIATLRVDFLARCSEIAVERGGRSLEDVAYQEDHRVFLGKIRPREMRAVIEEPARRVGLALEQGLAAQMIEDAGEEAGALPLLQYVLDEMWQKRRGSVLGWKEYEDLGRVGGALRQDADRIIARLDPIRQRAARRLLVQTVVIDEESHLDRRRRVPLAKLHRGPAAEAAVFEEVLSTLVDDRLLVRGGFDTAPVKDAAEATLVEVAHEQILRSWTTLRDWVREDRQMLVELRQIDGWVEEAKGFPRYVLDDDRLGHVHELMKRYPDDIGDAARELVRRSEAAVQAREEVARRKQQLTLGLGIGAAVAAVIMAVLALSAVRAQGSARAQANEAKQQASRAVRAKDRALIAGVRELLAHGQAAPASRVLLEVSEPQEARGWIELAMDVLQAGLTWATLRGHSDKVTFAAWSPDGLRLVTVSSDRTARVWNADGSGVPIVLKGHKGIIPFAAWSPDGLRLVTASWDGTARVWNADGRGAPVVLGDPDGAIVHSAEWSPDGLRLVTASFDKTARVWNADGRGAPVVLGGHKDAVVSAEWSPDGLRIVTTSKDRTARVWNAHGRGAPVVLEGHKGPLTSASFRPDGERIVTTSEDATLRIWPVDGHGEPVVLEGHRGAVRYGAWSPDGRRVVSASEDNTVRVWDADGHGVPVILNGHEGPITHARWSPDGGSIVTTSYDTTPRVWHIDAARPFVVLKGHKRPISSVAWSPDGRRVVTASWDGTARLWNADGRGVPVVLEESDRAINWGSWSPDGKRIATASGDNVARIWNADGSGAPITLKGHGGAVETTAWSPDGKRIVTASDTTARIWSADGKGDAIVFRDHEGIVESAAWSPDGKRIVTASADRTARIWSADGSGTPIVLEGHEWELTSAAWSPEGKRIATASADKTARIWRVDGSGTPIVLKGHSRTITAVAWSASGDQLATTSRDGTVRVWNADGSGEPIVLKGHEDEVLSVAWSPDGQRLATASSDKTVRIWPLSLPALQQALRDATTDCLSPEQRRVYLFEDDSDTRPAYEACERSHGREPYYPR